MITKGHSIATAVSILCHGGGSVTVPIASATPIPEDDQPDQLDNPWTDHHFGMD